MVLVCIVEITLISLNVKRNSNIQKVKVYRLQQILYLYIIIGLHCIGKLKGIQKENHNIFVICETSQECFRGTEHYPIKKVLKVNALKNLVFLVKILKHSDKKIIIKINFD